MCFREVSWVFKECFSGVLGRLKGLFNAVFKGVSMLFERS